MIRWKTTKANRAKGASTFLTLVLCFALAALPGCTYSVDDLPPGQTGVDLGVIKPSIKATPSEDDTSNPEGESKEDVPESILSYLPFGPLGPGNNYSVSSADVYPMGTALRGDMSRTRNITASVVRVVVTDLVPDGFYEEPRGTIWDMFPGYYEKYFPETCYLFVTFELTNLEDTINEGVTMLNGSMVFLINDAYQIRWNTIWDEYPLYQDFSDLYLGMSTVILLPNQTREVTLGYLIDKKSWFTEIDENEGWHFFVGVRDTKRLKSWDQPVIGYYGWLIDDDRITYQDFE